MTCLKCGHVAKIDAPYKVAYPSQGEDCYPICPECGNDNIGGYECYAPFGVWHYDAQKEILQKNRSIEY